MKTKGDRKEMYVPPTVELIPMEMEGCCMMSSSVSGETNVDISGGGIIGTRNTRGYNAAGSSELEDMINDILTIEQ